MHRDFCQKFFFNQQTFLNLCWIAQNVCSVLEIQSSSFQTHDGNISQLCLPYNVMYQAGILPRNEIAIDHGYCRQYKMPHYPVTRAICRKQERSRTLGSQGQSVKPRQSHYHNQVINTNDGVAYCLTHSAASIKQNNEEN